MPPPHDAVDSERKKHVEKSKWVVQLVGTRCRTPPPPSTTDFSLDNLKETLLCFQFVPHGTVLGRTAMTRRTSAVVVVGAISTYIVLGAPAALPDAVPRSGKRTVYNAYVKHAHSKCMSQ